MNPRRLPTRKDLRTAAYQCCWDLGCRCFPMIEIHGVDVCITHDPECPAANRPGGLLIIRRHPCERRTR